MDIRATKVMHDTIDRSNLDIRATKVMHDTIDTSRWNLVKSTEICENQPFAHMIAVLDTMQTPSWLSRLTNSCHFGPFWWVHA